MMQGFEQGNTQIDTVRKRFLHLTGLRDVEVREESAGLEVFLKFRVGADAPLYRRALDIINRETETNSEYHGRLLLDPIGDSTGLKSLETELLRSLITRSLRVTSDQATEQLVVDFVPFRGGEEETITQPANHVILGRRGVGKSSLILLSVRRVSAAGGLPIWIDLQPYRGRSDIGCIAEIIREMFDLAINYYKLRSDLLPPDQLTDASNLLSRIPTVGDRSTEPLRSSLPQIREKVRDFTRATGKQIYVFLDDAHLLPTETQPLLFDTIHSVLKGVGGWLNVAGVKNLTKLYDSSKHIGLQIPHDTQPVNLDLTLTDPAAARDHLVAILDSFLSTCGLRRRKVIPDAAVERLVWCSAGVPRDFLWLFQTGMQHALQNHRERVGVQEVNLAVGEFGQAKIQELAEDTTRDAESLRNLLENLQNKCLNELRTNSFLTRYTPHKRGYELLQKLMDLRLIHLLHPGITPGKAGERFEAYLLDYSFYTGVRRRHGLRELRISSESPPRYQVLRGLPRIEVEALMAQPPKTVLQRDPREPGNS